MDKNKIRNKILTNIEPVKRETAVPVIGPCWEWQKYRNPEGYGRINVDGKILLAHRTAFELFDRPIPEGMHVLHRCDNPVCCNPAHLFLGTVKDNMRDMFEKGRGKPGWVPGSKNGMSKLTESDIPEIFKLRGEGKSQRAIADAFGACQQHISDILNRKAWKHVEVDHG
jgi:hypothetical protein